MTKLRQQPAHNPATRVWHNVLGDGSSPSAPPRTPIRTKRSGDRQSARQSAGLVRAFGLRNTAIGFGRPFRPCCLWDPQTRSWRGHRDRHQTARSTDETEHRCLAGPLDGRIAQAGDADATWQSTARDRTSGENLLLVCLLMAPPSQELMEPPANPGRFSEA